MGSWHGIIHAIISLLHLILKITEFNEFDAVILRGLKFKILKSTRLKMTKLSMENNLCIIQGLISKFYQSFC